MILLDTNVISEVMRPAPDPRVVVWLDAQLAETLHLSSIGLAELLLGIAVLADGRRKKALDDALARAASLFRSRILAFDEAAATAYAALMSRARAAGQAIGLADGQIAATAMSRGLMVATHDPAPFETAGLKVVNPWTAAV